MTGRAFLYGPALGEVGATQDFRAGEILAPGDEAERVSRPRHARLALRQRLGAGHPDLANASFQQLHGQGGGGDSAEIGGELLLGGRQHRRGLLMWSFLVCNLLFGSVRI